MNRRSKSWVGSEQSSCLSTKLTFWKTWIIDKLWLVNFVVGLRIPILFCLCFPFFCRLWNVTKNNLKLYSTRLMPASLYLTHNVSKALTRFRRWAFIFSSWSKLHAKMENKYNTKVAFHSRSQNANIRIWMSNAFSLS